jgi:G3E family GTPase
MSFRSINIFLITGFLGSGKTTFLRHLLDQINSFPYLKCGVLMNEYGEENVDSVLLPQTEITFSSINGGSIFCSCRHTEFIYALKEFYESTEVNTLFIETSGLSNPSMIFQDLNIVNKQLGDVYKIKESICLVDASLLLTLMEAITSISTQLQVSSLAIINKIDLVDSRQVINVENVVRKENPDIRIYKTDFGEFNLKNLFVKQEMQIGEFKERRDEKGEFSSITLFQTNPFLEKELIDYVKSLNSSILRIKGYVNLGNDTWYRVDKVPGDFQLKVVTSHPDQGTLVFIFRDEIDQHKLRSEWNSLGTK